MKIELERNRSGKENMIGEIKKYTLDTNIIIDQLRGFKMVDDIFQSRTEDENFVTFISVITELEIYSGKSMNNIHCKNIANKLLSKMLKISVDSSIAKYAGQIKRKFSISFPDALIAATAIQNKCTLITRNVKHFKEIPKLKVIKPE